MTLTYQKLDTSEYMISDIEIVYSLFLISYSFYCAQGLKLVFIVRSYIQDRLKYGLKKTVTNQSEDCISVLRHYLRRS